MGHDKTFTDNPQMDGGLVDKTFKVALGVGIGGLALSGVGYATDSKQFFFSFLVAFWFFLSIALGGLFFTVLHHLVRAGWSTGWRRIAENLSMNVLLMAGLFVVVLLGIGDLYHWSHAEAVAKDPILQWKKGYLNSGFFIGRAVFYFLIWSAMAIFFRKNSVAQDANGDESISFRMRKLAPISTLVFALSISFAGFDWIMSLDPHWFSTIFGLCMFAGAMVSIYATLALTGLWMTKNGQLKETLTIGNFHDAGKMMFGFLVFWTYVTFSQYYLIWYGNIPEETAYYIHRLQGGWEMIGLLLLVGHFFIPFWFLMSRHMKRHRMALGLGAGWMLLMHYADIYFYAMPVAHHHLHPSWMDATCMLGIGGLFVALFVRRFKSEAMVAHKDPQLTASFRYDNV